MRVVDMQPMRCRVGDEAGSSIRSSIIHRQWKEVGMPIVFVVETRVAAMIHGEVLSLTGPSSLLPLR